MTIWKVLKRKSIKFSFLFLNKLHQKNNLSKSCILEIYNLLKHEIIIPLCSLMKIDQSTSNIIINSHQKFNSQYKYEKKVNQEGFIASGKT